MCVAGLLMDKQAVCYLYVIPVRYDLFYQVKKFQRKFIGVNAAILRQISDRLKLQIIYVLLKGLPFCEFVQRKEDTSYHFQIC